ncbi:MAG: shikimate kinase [Lachnospiraceae bacterium]|nr:shikimate kinase [Lachnospiraceae bacterium]
MLKDNIVLVGMPGAGKSTVGVILAKVLGYEFVDSDLIIQKETGKLLAHIIAEKGIDGFIEVENRINASINCNKSIIATGGSVVYGEEAMRHLKAIGEIVYINLPYDVLEQRLGNIKQRGVVLKEGQNLKTLYDERCPMYEKYADIIVDAKDMGIEELVSAISQSYKKI